MASDEPPNQTLEVADPDDYNQTRRLRQIHNARERVEEAILDGFEDVAEGVREPENYDELVAENLLLYLVQVEPLLTSPRILKENGAPSRKEARFWREVEVVVEENEDGETLTEERVEGVEIEDEIYTLEKILESDAEVEKPGDNRALSVDESRKAYRLVNRFLKEVGFGLDYNEPMAGHPSTTRRDDYLSIDSGRPRPERDSVVEEGPTQ